MRFLERGTGGRYERCDFFERHNRVDDDLAHELSFKIGHHRGVPLVGNGDYDKISGFYRLLIGGAGDFSGAQFWFQCFDGMLGLLGIARADNDFYSRRAQAQRQSAAQVARAANDRHAELVHNNHPN